MSLDGLIQRGSEMSKKDIFVESIREFLRNNQFKEAFQSLDEHGYENDSTNFLSRLNRLDDEERKGTISSANAEVERNILVEDIIKFVNKIPGDDFLPPSNKPYERLMGALLGGLVGAFFGLTWILRAFHDSSLWVGGIFYLITWVISGVIVGMDRNRRFVAVGGAMVGAVSEFLSDVLNYNRFKWDYMRYDIFNDIFKGGAWAMAGAICGMDRRLLFAASIGVIVGLILDQTEFMTGVYHHHYFADLEFAPLGAILGALVGVIIKKRREGT